MAAGPGRRVRRRQRGLSQGRGSDNATKAQAPGLTPRAVFTEEAENQFFEILDYLEEHGGKDVAARVRNAIQDAVERLAERPGIGHARKDLTERPVKFWAVYSYLIVYDPNRRPLTVVALLHSARNVGRLLR